MVLICLSSFTLRVALLSNCTFGDSPHHCRDDPSRPGQHLPSQDIQTYSRLLNAHAASLVTGADLEYNFSGDRATTVIRWRVKALSAAAGRRVQRLFDENFGASTVPLMLTMPHHRSQTLNGCNLVLGTSTFRSISGVQVPAVGAVWALSDEMPSIAWAAPRSVSDSDKLNQIKKALESDLAWELPINYKTGTGDPYNAGKLLSRMANIALVADAVGAPKEQSQKFLRRMASALEYWLNGTSGNMLVYDESWGGVVTCGCQYTYPPPACANTPPQQCPALGGDPVSDGFDFGNGAYNDHHFHYGYMIYAAAVAAKLIPGWAERYAPVVDFLVRDIANPNPADKFFPVFRHTDWYMGHSWAGGVAMAYLNGRNQESVTEAINAWYAVSLWGRATGRAGLRDTGRLLAAMEIRAAHTYWQIPSLKSDIYPRVFAEHHTAGIVWSNLIQYQTWVCAQFYF